MDIGSDKSDTGLKLEEKGKAVGQLLAREDSHHFTFAIAMMNTEVGIILIPAPQNV